VPRSGACAPATAGTSSRVPAKIQLDFKVSPADGGPEKDNEGRTSLIAGSIPTKWSAVGFHPAAPVQRRQGIPS
jgi:hypothetical protein